MLLLRTLTIPFINMIPKDDIPSPYHNFPPAPPYEQSPLDPITKEPLPLNTPLTDRKPVDVAFSSDGKIAVMYRRGGVIVYKPIKLYSVGNFDSMPVSDLDALSSQSSSSSAPQMSCFDHLLSYCDYSDYEALRECCVYFHHHTRRLRSSWSLAPLGTSFRHTVAVYQFMKWALAPFRDHQIKFGIPSPIKPSDLTPLDRIVFYDQHGRECCARYWVNGPMQPLTSIDSKSLHQFINSRHTSGRCCENIVCVLSHDLPVIPYHFLQSLDAGINYQGTLLAISRLYGDDFIWKKESYLQRLFETMSDKCQAEHRHDPMTRRNEVIREITIIQERYLPSSTILHSQSVLSHFLSSQEIGLFIFS
jgi:hypothetical protein